MLAQIGRIGMIHRIPFLCFRYSQINSGINPEQPDSTMVLKPSLNHEILTHDVTNQSTLVCCATIRPDATLFALPKSGQLKHAAPVLARSSRVPVTDMTQAAGTIGRRSPSNRDEDRPICCACRGAGLP
ncbi:hypothetical protein BR93DRAFT_329469 [Coniochaeta sp. PMI_546]|nr:hypothetical protein BR93DRAFT_329469 [Coniochaeta sp. PMI_546]